MDDWFNKGCEECRHGILSGRTPPPTLISDAVRDGPVLLHQCGICGAYWEDIGRNAYVIPEDEAQVRFPAVFNTGNG